MTKNDQAVRNFILNSHEVLTPLMIVNAVLWKFERAPFKNLQNANKRVSQIIKMMLDEKLIAYWSTPETDQICRIEDAEKYALSCEKFVVLQSKTSTSTRCFRPMISVHEIAQGDKSLQMRELDNGQIVLYHNNNYIPIYDLTDRHTRQYPCSLAHSLAYSLAYSAEELNGHRKVVIALKTVRWEWDCPDCGQPNVEYNNGEKVVQCVECNYEFNIEFKK